MASQPGEKVKLQTMINRETTSNGEFAVLVQVTAPATLLPTEHSDSAGIARGVDLVAVLDVSASMNEENNLERMKEAMFSVLDQLRLDDRLCILSFNDEVQTLTELSFMSDENWAKARGMVECLTASSGGGANVKAATEAAATILAQRGEDEQRDRVSRVIFLSSGGGEEDAVADDPGLQKQNHATSTSTSTSTSDVLAPDAFVLGADHKLKPMTIKAGSTSAAYSCVEEDVDKIMDAPGLMSVEATMGVQVELHVQDGVTISSIDSGNSDDPVRVGKDGPWSLTIYVQDLHASEQKSFTVYLAVPEGKEELLAVTGWYRDVESDEDVQLDVCEVSVPPPIADAPVDEAVDPQKPEEMDRVEEEETVPEKKPDMPDIQEHKDTTIPDEKRDTPVIPKQEETMRDENKATPASVPGKVVVPAKQAISYTSLFVLVSASLSVLFFAVRNLLFWAWNSVAKQAKSLRKGEERKFGKVKIMWAWTRNNLYYPCALVLLLLGAATLFGAWKQEPNEKSSSLEVPQHQSWSQREESFDLVMLKEMENAGITTCFNSALVAEMCPAMNKYIYQAIVHGRGVHVPLLGQTAQKVEMEKAVAASCKKKKVVVQHDNSNAHFQDLRGEC